MKNIVVFAVAVIALAGCELDRMSGTEFDVTPEKDAFTFVATSDNLFPENTADGEAHRMRYLQKWLSDNSMCLSGYEIDSRTSVYVGGALHRITYEGHCK